MGLKNTEIKNSSGEQTNRTDLGKGVHMMGCGTSFIGASAMIIIAGQAAPRTFFAHASMHKFEGRISR